MSKAGLSRGRERYNADWTGAYLGIAANLLFALFASVGEFRLITGQTMRFLITKDVALTG